jgi:hypothetical protein
MGVVILIIVAILQVFQNRRFYAYQHLQGLKQHIEILLYILEKKRFDLWGS